MSFQFQLPIPAPRNLIKERNLVYTTLEFTKGPEDHVIVTDREWRRSWTTSHLLATFFLLSSFKNPDKNERLLSSDAVEAHDIFRDMKTLVFEGYFPFDQIVFQVCGLPYDIHEDQVSRYQICTEQKRYYLCLVEERDLPKQKYRFIKGDVVLKTEPQKSLA